MNQEEMWLLKEKYGGEKTEGFFTDCERLQAGEPLGYLIGHVPFLDCTIHLDNHPLIPRPETEFWVEQAIDEIKKTTIKTPAVLDLCAGSGAIGVAVAKALPEAYVYLAEIDKNLIPTIIKNLQKNIPNYSNRLEYIQTMQSDLFSDVSNKYHYILSNPPYIDPALDRTESSVKNFEPHLALYGGEAGLELIANIIREAPQHLYPRGELWLEHEPEQSAATNQLGNTHGFHTTSHKDQYGVERYSRLVLQ